MPFSTVLTWRVPTALIGRNGSYLSLANGHWPNAQQTYDVETTSMRHHDVTSTLVQRCLKVVCPLGKTYMLYSAYNKKAQYHAYIILHYFLWWSLSNDETIRM